MYVPLQVPKVQYSIVIQKPAEEKPKQVTVTVSDGQTLTSIAEATGSSVGQLWAANTQLSNPDLLEPGMVLNVPQTVLPERPMPSTIEVGALNSPNPLNTSKPPSGGFSSSGNAYDFGYCTFGVKNWRPDIPNSWGEASSWYGNAQAMGWPTGSVPKVGAIAWARNYDHVAYVIAVSGNSVTVREENYIGYNKVSTRVTDTSEWLYIY